MKFLLRAIASKQPEQAQTKASLTAQLVQLIALDQQLQQRAEVLSKKVDFALLRISVSPAETAWWWHLDQVTALSSGDHLNWLWQGITLLTWTANLGLLLNIVGRFLSGGPGVGGSAAALLSDPQKGKEWLQLG